MQVACHQFRSCEFPRNHQVVQVAFRAGVVQALLGVHPFLCASSVSVDPLLCRFGKKGSCGFDLEEQLLSWHERICKHIRIIARKGI